MTIASPSRTKSTTLPGLLGARPRLLGSAVFGLLVAFSLPATWVSQLISRLIIGWDTGIGLYLLLVAHMMFRSSHETLRQRALQEDEGQLMILVLVVIASIASLTAIGAELAVVKGMRDSLRYAHIALAAVTILSSWAFTHVMFALHYAHDYYLATAHGQHGGLEFPGTELPQYGDFVYFACVIGTSGQTADVSFATRRMRGIGTLHCVLAFFFNTTILALTINIAAGLF